ncbi:MAG TPA: transposase [Nitrososphaerales archaeon]|nr:transposase [Nitrososphaerales archaeon]
MRLVKAIRFGYDASEELRSLFEEFRLMCNDAIRIALKEKPKTRFRLIELAYPRLREYGLHTHYILSACEVAYSAFKNPKRRSDPYVRKSFIKLDNQTFTLNHLILRIPTTPRHFIYLTLRAADYHLSFVDDAILKRGSITLTESLLDVAFSKQIAEIKPKGRMGIDVNERNVTWSHSSGLLGKEDTSKVAELKERYKAIRAKIAQRTNKDARLRRELLSKYGKREKDRTTQAIHRVTKRIVEHAKTNGLAIVMENLKGIRKLYRKGNGQGPSFRGRMNSWMFREIQRQTEYKARWEGNPVHYVNPRGTSRKCPTCGSSLVELEGRRLWCPLCDKTEDRDVVASMNLTACAVPQARPSG